MASRDISGAILRTCFGAVRKDVTPSKILKMALEGVASAQRDIDKTGDMDSYYYYLGLQDAFASIAQTIAPLKDEKVKVYEGLLDLLPGTDNKAA